MFCSILTVVTPVWQTNDDVWISMLVHGYGITSSPVLTVFASNAAWAWFVNHIPTVQSIHGYTIASYLVMFLSLWAILYVFISANRPLILSAAVIALVGIFPIVSPQFNITAGLAGCSGLLNLAFYKSSKRLSFAVCGSLLLVVCFCIRESMAVLLAFISIPMFIGTKLLFDKRFLTCCTLVFLICTSLFVFDKYQYSGEEWQRFHAFPGRQVYDFGMARLLEKNSDILARFGYTVEDIKLFCSQFFVYPFQRDLNFTEINGMISTYSFLDRAMLNIALIPSGLSALFQKNILPMLSLGFILSLFSRNRVRLFTVLLLILVSIVGMTIAGRPAILRVYYPIVTLFFIVTFNFANFKDSSVKTWSFSILTFSILFYSALSTYYDSALNPVMVRSSQAAFKEVNERFHPIINAAYLPFELIYAPFSQDALIDQIQLTWLVNLIVTPVGNASKDDLFNAFLPRFMSKEGLSMLTGKYELELMDYFCKYRLNGTFESSATSRYLPWQGLPVSPYYAARMIPLIVNPALEVFTVRCNCESGNDKKELGLTN